MSSASVIVVVVDCAVVVAFDVAVTAAIVGAFVAVPAAAVVVAFDELLLLLLLLCCYRFRCLVSLPQMYGQDVCGGKLEKRTSEPDTNDNSFHNSWWNIPDHITDS